ncbi:hypothetical protein XA68_10210 [Ophiocordyceps unilateralis]|uniref:Oxidoreductase NAD-binding domain-containing protein 1 n=1 Tax=Ophiocordyceps unilateralis TaxID=268505 RepID=A0A2A9PIZ5_OPHUN|nr:hypothetical protein XA68_10210 [Ophiocordyceps unilateralis]
MASTSHLERTAHEPRHSEILEGSIVRVDEVNERIRLFRLELRSGPAKFSPGQWLDTYVPNVAKPGGFTITSAPSAAMTDSPYLELAVAKSAENAVAAWLWRPSDQLMGEMLRLRIGGSFVFPPPASSNLSPVRSLVLVAGGVGINPLVSIVRSIAESRPALDIDVRFLYASKLPASGRLQDVLFLYAIAALFEQRKLRGWLRLYATGADTTGLHQVPGTSVDVRSGRLSSDEVRSVVRELNPAETFVYICGPPVMTDELIAALTAPGQEGSLESERVLTEKWW